MHYNDSLDAAQRYVQRGFSVFPCHTIEDGRCSCGKADCFKDAAKHPLTENGVDDATNDSAKLQSYFSGAYAIANVGIATGDRSGVIVIDIDDEAAIARLESEFGTLPKTWTVCTGSGGRHLYFKYEDRFASVKNSVKFCGSLDVRTTGGYVLAPPSLHASGKRYEWLVSPDDCGLAALPEWLYRLLPKRETKTQRIERAKTIDERLFAYLEKTPPAIQGEGGDNRTFAVACRIVELFGSDLDDEALLSGLQAWNERCEPPWNESDLRRKIAEARAKVGSSPNR